MHPLMPPKISLWRSEARSGKKSSRLFPNGDAEKSRKAQWDRVAGGLGFEPRLAESESVVWLSKDIEILCGFR
jgi:hypothetical protein